MTWKLRYAAHLGIGPADPPLFGHSAGSPDPVDQIRYAAEIGFAGVADNNAVSRAPDVLDRMRVELDRHGLEMGCIVNSRRSIRESLWGRSGADVRAMLIGELDETIAAARRLGARHLTTVCMRDPDLPLETQKANMIEHLRTLAERADQAGVVIVLEQTSEQRMPGMIVQHCKDLCDIVRAVDAPSVRIVFDLCHCQYMDGNLIGNLDLCRDHIAAIQIADVPERRAPGSGEINFPFVLRHIHQCGYAGLVEVEAFVPQPDFRREQAMLEQLRAIDSAI